MSERICSQIPVKGSDAVQLSAYEIRLAPAAARSFKKLPPQVRARIRSGLDVVAKEAAEGRGFRGKRMKETRGARDSFKRLRAEDYRVMFDPIDDKRVVLVLGLVHRRDLERWIRNR